MYIKKLNFNPMKESKKIIEKKCKKVKVKLKTYSKEYIESNRSTAYKYML